MTAQPSHEEAIAALDQLEKLRSEDFESFIAFHDEFLRLQHTYFAGMAASVTYPELQRDFEHKKKLVEEAIKTLKVANPPPLE